VVCDAAASRKRTFNHQIEHASPLKEIFGHYLFTASQVGSRKPLLDVKNHADLMLFFQRASEHAIHRSLFFILGRLPFV